MFRKSNQIPMLNIQINGERRLREIQSEFTSFFPFLKVEFFKAPHSIGEGSAKTLLYDLGKVVRDCRKLEKDGSLQIVETMTVHQLEQEFFNQFGLAAQVFRKSGNVWLETSATDNWTLIQQNNEGAELSTQIRENSEDQDNIDPY